MNILFIAPTPFFSDRGCHVRILEEAEALKAKGHKVIIATYGLGKDISGFEIARTMRIPWYKKTEAGPSYQKIYMDFLLVLKCLKITRRNKIDIIHAHLHEGVFVGRAVNLLRIFRKKIPIIADIQGSLVKEMIDHGYLKNDLIRKMFTIIEKIILRMPNIIITSSTNAAKILKSEFNVKKNVIPVCDAVDTEKFKPCSASKIRSLKKKYGIDNEKVIVFLGLLNEYQGVDVLLEAIKKVVKKYDKVKFMIMGFPNIDKYKNIARKLGIAEQAIFTGRVDYRKAPKMLCMGDVAVSFKTSLTEANGKLYNYIACGLPCVVSDIPVNREILGKEAAYAKVNDPVDSADKILFLLNNPAKMKELGDRSRKRSIDFSWDKRIEIVLDVYNTARKVAK